MVASPLVAAVVTAILQCELRVPAVAFSSPIHGVSTHFLRTYILWLYNDQMLFQVCYLERSGMKSQEVISTGTTPILEKTLRECRGK